jgi:hypothetical protein
MRYSGEMVLNGIIYKLNIMKIGTGVEGILRSCLKYLKGCNIGTTDGNDQ